ncbi:MAG: YqiA/YcfP family alpha/beta fold hydrolase [Candidatus Sulfobium sp.]
MSDIPEAPVKDLIFLHGFASSAKSTKARYLAERLEGITGVRFLVPDFNPAPRDFEYLTVTGMINRLRQYLVDHEAGSPDIIASSLGALVALHYVRRFGGGRLLLLAPVLSYRSLPFAADMLTQWEKAGITEVSHYGFPGKVLLRYDFHVDGMRYSEEIPPPSPVLILHGSNDEVIPVTNSRNYASRYPDEVRLAELDSDHGLLDRMETIWEQVLSFILNPVEA